MHIWWVLRYHCNYTLESLQCNAIHYCLLLEFSSSRHQWTSEIANKITGGTCESLQLTLPITILEYCNKNTERHTAHTIVSWPNPKQWVIVHTSYLMMIKRYSIYLRPITREKVKLKTHSPTYCIMDNWENMPYLTHTLDKIYLTGIL